MHPENYTRTHTFKQSHGPTHGEVHKKDNFLEVKVGNVKEGGGDGGDVHACVCESVCVCVGEREKRVFLLAALDN